MQAVLRARGVLLDLDGTLVSGGAALPGARALLDRVAGRCAIVSNDAEHTASQLAGKLRRLGLVVPQRRILLAGCVALEHIAAEQPGARIMLLGSLALRRYAARLGLLVVADAPAIVLLGRDRGFSFARLAAAANALRRGARLLVCNPDLTHPGPQGAVVPETGALLAAVLACAGDVPVTVIGKPEPALFLVGMAALGTTATETVMVGDNPATDGLGARRLGLGYVQAGPGLLAQAAALDKAA